MILFSYQDNNICSVYCPILPIMLWSHVQHHTTLRGHEATPSFPIFYKNNKAFSCIDTHSTCTFLSGMLCRVQLVAAEVTLRKHSCFSSVWCHHGTTPPLLIFNKDETFISQLQAVRALQLLEHEDEINSSGCFFSCVICTAMLRWWLITDEESLRPYHRAMSGCYDKVKCTLLTHATWHTSREWPQSAINRPSPRSHQGRHNSHSLSVLGQIHRELPIFSAGALEGSVSLSAHSYLLKQQTSVLHKREAPTVDSWYSCSLH